MTIAKAPQKPKRVTSVDGLKAAISATALAVTIGGWGWLTAQNPVEITAATPAIVVEPPIVERQPLPQWLTQNPSLPTIPTVAPLHIPSRDNVAAASSAPAAQAAPVAPPPPPAPALREVTIPLAPAAPPAPAARTRSSR